MRRASLGAVLLALSALVITTGLPAGAGERGARPARGYIVLMAGHQNGARFSAAGPAAQVRSLVKSHGGSIVGDLASRIGVMIVRSRDRGFADALRSSSLIAGVVRDFRAGSVPTGRPEAAKAPDRTALDPMEDQQWDMKEIRSPQAHEVETGIRAVDVGMLDTGIDGTHEDFRAPGGASNVDCARGHDSIAVGPGIGDPDPCVDNQIHGTHTAGTVGAQINGVGIVGVAPGITLVPVKVCDAVGFCYASSVVDGIVYAGRQKLDVLNMSFFVDDNAPGESTEFKCLADPEQRTFRRAVERALIFAESRGATPVAALGNSSYDLDNPPPPYNNSCEIVPAESPGVIGVTALGNLTGLASYSNWGFGPADMSAPGGDGFGCASQVLSTLPGDDYGCLSGTSMAAPHVAGVAALIQSHYGAPGPGGDIELDPALVAAGLRGTAVDIGPQGYDKCYGSGRVDAFRAVSGETTPVSDPRIPLCSR